MRHADDRQKLMRRTGVVAGLILVILFVCVYLIGLNLFRPQIESAVSKALGMDVSIGGDINLDLIPRPAIAFGKLRVGGQGTELLAAEGLSLAIRFRELLRGRIQIHHLTFRNPTVRIIRDTHGIYNFPLPAPEQRRQGRPPAVPPVLAVERLSVTDGEVVYADAKTGTQVTMNRLNLDVKDFLAGSRDADRGTRGVTVKDLSFSAEMSADAVTIADFPVSNIRFGTTVRNGIVRAGVRSFRVFGGKGSGNVSVDLHQAAPKISVQATLAGFRTKEFITALGQEKTMDGPMDLLVDLQTSDADSAAMLRNLTGTFELRGEELTLHMIDPDKLLDRLQKSHTFSVVDIGAYFFAGPLGTVLTKGYDFAGVYGQVKGGTGSIRRVVSRWKINAGIAEADDVAVTTARNRIAVKGKLDFVNRRYENLTVAILDRQGCAVMSQPIIGPFSKPSFGTVSVLKSVVGPVLDVLAKTKSIVLLETCTPFYSGSLEHPEGTSRLPDKERVQTPKTAE